MVGAIQIEIRGGNGEQRTGAGGDAQGRVHSDVGREAREVAGGWAALRRLGDVSPEGIAGGSESSVRVADQRLVRADVTALERRRQDVGSGGQQIRLRRR